MSRCKGEVPTISKVSKVTPGEKFAIGGNGLGQAPGKVDVLTGGRVFPAQITLWNECQITAQMSNDIGGFLYDGKAMVEVRTGSGREVRAVTQFSPFIATEHLFDKNELSGGIFGDSKYFHHFDFRLMNDWYQYESSVFLGQLSNGHAEITSGVYYLVPNGSALVSVRVGVAAFGVVDYHVYETIAGPKGLPYK